MICSTMFAENDAFRIFFTCGTDVGFDEIRMGFWRTGFDLTLVFVGWELEDTCRHRFTAIGLTTFVKVCKIVNTFWQINIPCDHNCSGMKRFLWRSGPTHAGEGR